MVVAVKRFIVNNSLGGSGPPLPAGVGADQPKGILGGTSVSLAPGQAYPYPETPLQPGLPQYPGGYGPPTVPIPHVSEYNTAQCPPNYYRSGGICLKVETGEGLTIGAKGAIQQVQADPQTFPGQMFLLKILVTNIGTTAAKWSAKVTIPAIGITALPTAGTALEPGASAIIHKSLQMPMSAPPGQLLPATIELIQTSTNGVSKTDDTENATIPSPGTMIPGAGL